MSVRGLLAVVIGLVTALVAAATTDASVAATAAATSATSAATTSAVTTSAATTSAATTSAATAPQAGAGSAGSTRTVDAVDAAVTSAAESGVDEHVVVVSRSTGQVIAEAGDGEAVPSMSLVKLLIATDVIAEAGGVDQLSAGTLAELTTMISRSDDEIASDLYAEGGGTQLIERSIKRYGLTGTTPAVNEEYWGDVRVTATDMASLLYQALSTPVTGPWLAGAMQLATDTAADGFDQAYGMNAVVGAGSKQGWACCLGGVVSIHSAGFTDDRIAVVLTTSEPDQDSGDLQTAKQLAADPGAQTAIELVSRAAVAALS